VADPSGLRASPRLTVCPEELKPMRHFVASIGALAISLGVVLVPHAFAQAKPSIAVLSPSNGDTVTSTDIPVRVQVSNFTLSAPNVGMPDKDGEGHIHVMLDGMNMGVLFNFYTTPTFTLPGQGVRPGQHTLTVDLASNTHEDMEDTVTNVTINYQPLTAQAAPQASPSGAAPEVSIVWPPDGATVGPLFTLQVSKTNFSPSLELEGKPNLAGYGHYHVFVDMPMMDMTGGGGQGMGSMMSMAGMIAMVGNDSIPVDLRAWSNGKHTITVEPVQNDHTPIQGAKEAMITITLQGAATAQALDGE
jgi:hypothetical protein